MRYGTKRAQDREQCRIEVYTYICNHIQKNGDAPSVGEICEKLGLAPRTV